MTNDNPALQAAAGTQPLTMTREEYDAWVKNDLRDQLAIHAPPCPIWFLSKELGEGTWNNDHEITRAAQWPWHYADLVLSTRSNQSNL